MERVSSFEIRLNGKLYVEIVEVEVGVVRYHLHGDDEEWRLTKHSFIEMLRTTMRSFLDRLDERVSSMASVGAVDETNEHPAVDGVFVSEPGETQSSVAGTSEGRIIDETGKHSVAGIGVHVSAEDRFEDT